MKTLSMNFDQKKNLTSEIDRKNYNKESKIIVIFRSFAHLLNGYRGVYIGTGASIDLSSGQFDVLIKT